MSVTFAGQIFVKRPLIHNEESSEDNRTTGMREEGKKYDTDHAFRREAYICNGRILMIPLYTGNALRGILRREGMKYLFERLGLKETDMDQKIYYLFSSGGGLDKKQKKEEISLPKVAGLKQMIRETFPLLSLFGCSYGYAMMAGKLSVDTALPIVKEMEEYTGIESDLELSMITNWTFYTRLDDFENKDEIPEEKKEDEKGGPKTQKILRYEYIVPGTSLQHQFIFDDTVTELEYSCFGALLERFKTHAYIGGKSNIGNGLVELQNYTASQEIDLSPEKYEQFISDHKQQIIDCIYSFKHGQPPVTKEK